MLPSRKNCLIYASALTNKSLVARILGVSTGSFSDCSGEVVQEIKSAWVYRGPSSSYLFQQLTFVCSSPSWNDPEGARRESWPYIDAPKCLLHACELLGSRPLSFSIWASRNVSASSLWKSQEQDFLILESTFSLSSPCIPSALLVF